MNVPEYQRNILEFIIGPPDMAQFNGRREPDRLVWTCGCNAVVRSGERYAITACPEHRPEFDTDA